MGEQLTAWGVTHGFPKSRKGNVYLTEVQAPVESTLEFHAVDLWELD